MPIYQSPLRDYAFVLNEYLKVSEQPLPGFEGADELIQPLLEEGARFCEQVLFPLNQSGDAQGLKWKNGTVTVPDGFADAYRQYVEGGWPSFTGDPEYGGQGLPEALSMPLTEMICSANLSFGLTPGLSHGAIHALHNHGSDELKQMYLPKMISGEWSGVMGLTEPQCGTDLGLITTKAEPVGDGSYKVSGQKIFISSGEHEMTSNIVHLVLAKLPDAPKGTRGISLFLVPKFLPDANGDAGARNGVHCDGIEHKMGIHASPTCVMRYDNATGWLVGEPHKGLRAMFTMMNDARLYVGVQGLGIAEVAYQNALAYAKERLQGRALSGAVQPDKPADPIIVHPDVRRMLLTMKAFTEGARALVLEAALKLDTRNRATGEEAELADDWIQLMTPIIKAYLTDMGTECASLAMQVYGGYGYIREYGVEQYLRDARIAQIYEGTNGIQALDLVGRKLPFKYGRYLRAFTHPCAAFIEEHRENPGMAEFTKPLYGGLKQLQQASLWIAQAGLRNQEDAAAAATDYLRLFALVAMGFTWAKTAEIALRKHGEDEEFYGAKLATARFFMAKMLPETASCLLRITGGGKVLREAVL